MDARAAVVDTPPGTMDLVRLVTAFNLHPERHLHPSWLPPAWPPRHRRPERFGPAAQELLGHLLQRGAPHAPEFNFDSRLRRLALLDGASLRRLALYCGLCTHKPLFKLRGVSAQLRRQARRLDPDAVDFVLDRVPLLTEPRMDASALQQRPITTGRVVAARGYRLLLAAMSEDTEAIRRRVLWKLPRRVSTLAVPRLAARQAAQLSELMLLCIVPERLPQWDWLF